MTDALEVVHVESEVLDVDQEDEWVPSTGRGALEQAVYIWRRALARLHERLKTSTITDVWIAGFKAAGIAARRGGRRVGTAWVYWPFVIEIPCPQGHRSEDRRDYAKVQLITEDDGWVTFDRENSCRECTQYKIEKWLLNCPRCESGDKDSLWHKSGHAKGVGHRTGQDRDGVVGILGDTSPLSFVISEFEVMWKLADAKHWVENTEQAAATYRKDLGDVSVEYADRAIEQKFNRSKWLLAQTQTKAVQVAKTDWKPDATVKWLDDLIDIEGKPLVPALTSGAAAWRLVASLNDRPPKHALEAAQATRKSRSAAP